MLSLVDLLTPMIFMPGDYVIRQGEIGRALYFINRGSVIILIDIGPGAGHDGGRVVFEGTPEQLVADASTLTGQHLKEYVGAEARRGAQPFGRTTRRGGPEFS